MPAPLIDRRTLSRYRARAARNPALFLQQRAADEIKERLALVNRSFTAPAVVTAWPDVWCEALPGAKLVADDETLDLETASHDLVIHALCLHWAEDPVGQLIQSRSALRPDGLFVGSLLGGQTLHELRAVLAEAEVSVAGGLSPRVLPMSDIRDLGNLMQRAGFALPVADSERAVATYRDTYALMRDLRAMGEANAMSDRLRRFTRRHLLAEAAERYRSCFGLPDGRIPATFEFIHLTGWAPGPGQPRPLRPGSAVARLADVLGSTETRIPDTGETEGD